MTITPDTKDWTWVLQRRCPECGFDSREFPRTQVGAMLRSNAASWREVLSAPDVRQRPRPDVWSPLEYACHVRDVHKLYVYRLEDGSTRRVSTNPAADYRYPHGEAEPC